MTILETLIELDKITHTFELQIKNEVGVILNIYKATSGYVKNTGADQYAVEAYMEDNKLTTFGTGETITIAWQRAKLIEEGHRVTKE